MSNLKKQNSSASVSPRSAHQALCILATLAGIFSVNLRQTDARASLADQPPSQRFTFTKIATLGVSPNFGDFEVGQINNRGDVSFSAVLNNGDQGVYVKSGSALRLV